MHPEKLDFRPWVVGAVDVRRDIRTREGSLSSPGAAELGFSPQGQLPRACRDPLLKSAEGEPGGTLDEWNWGSENAGMKTTGYSYNIRSHNNLAQLIAGLTRTSEATP